MPLQPNHLNASQCAAPQECATVARPCTTLEDFFRAQDSQISFSVTHGWSAFGGADHVWQDVGLEGGSWTLSQPVFGPVRSQGAAGNGAALRVGADRSWRSQEHSADGGAACAW